MICESSRRINAFNAKVFNGNILHMLDGHRYGIDGNYYWHCSCGNNFLEYKHFEKHLKRMKKEADHERTQLRK